MRKYTFRGGVHPDDAKRYTKSLPIVVAHCDDEMEFPMRQHIGAECVPCVAVGDEVFVGQKIGDSDAFVSAPIHSSISGKVTAIDVRTYATGRTAVVVIENDHAYKVDPNIKPAPHFSELSPEELVARVRDAGITGLGGAGFPTHVKLSPPKDKQAEYVIINGAECEPYVTADHRVMLERADLVLYGIEAEMKILGAKKAFICIEDNKQDAIDLFCVATKGTPDIDVVVLKKKYPQGSEKQLIDACLRRRVPAGKLPIDVGVVVDNISTAAQIATTLKTGMPLIDRVVTVSGDGVKNPANYQVRLGTSYKTLFEQSDGFEEDIRKVIAGGPMMGQAQFSLEDPVIKGTSSLLALREKSARYFAESSCLRCGKCVDACPMKLIPMSLCDAIRARDFDRIEKLHLSDCMECGACSYICPARRQITQTNRLGKTLVKERGTK